MTHRPPIGPVLDGPRDLWDVTSWVFGPPQPYRLNALFRRDDGALVTASGCFADSVAAADLGGALRPFDRLGCPVVVDVCHAVLGDLAVRALVDAGLRHSASTTGFAVTIVHADPATRQRVASAGGALLLRPCVRCQLRSAETSRARVLRAW